jgi:hypothetical protein
MSADELRQAAWVLRDRNTNAHDLALADWLDDIAAGWMWDGEEPNVVDFDGDHLTLEESLDMHAVKIARLINGEVSA